MVKGVGRRLEGPDRERELDGRQPHHPGARHRENRHRGRERRPQTQAPSSKPRVRSLELADTINAMIDTLATFADQVTTVAREVGVEGELGGQARVPGAAGIWRDLTNNVNQLAANLTTQVRAIAEVATAVTKGKITRSILGRDARRTRLPQGQHQRDDSQLAGETTRQEHRAGLAKDLTSPDLRGMLQGQSRPPDRPPGRVLSELAPLVTAQHGVFLCKPRGPKNDYI